MYKDHTLPSLLNVVMGCMHVPVGSNAHRHLAVLRLPALSVVGLYACVAVWNNTNHLAVLWVPAPSITATRRPRPFDRGVVGVAARRSEPALASREELWRAGGGCVRARCVVHVVSARCAGLRVPNCAWACARTGSCVCVYVRTCLRLRMSAFPGARARE